ncbi:hypothetical protein E4O93_16085 [Diaphorobacter sp. DS2]|nr:hypothetical protein E4O93_16085 [Diaphorobacter sp. DS2]
MRNARNDVLDEINMKPRRSPSLCYGRYRCIEGFDRLHFWLNQALSHSHFKRLDGHCGSYTVRAIQPRYQAGRKCFLALHQPTPRCLEILRELLGSEVNAELTYAEVTRDLRLPQPVSLELRKVFVRAVQMPYQRELSVDHKGSRYWGMRSKAGSRQGSVLTLYTDLPSKLHNARPRSDAPPCFHIEWRASGKAALAKLGLRSVDDLIDFDHERHWDTCLNLFGMPRKTDLGRLLAACQGGRSDATDTAYRQRATRWIAAHSQDGEFVLHNALKSVPKLALHLDRTDWRGLLQLAEKRASRY